MISVEQLIKLAVSTSVLLLVVGLGMKVSFHEATSLFRHPFRPPYSIVRALLAMNFIVPLVAAAITMAFELPAAVKVAIVTMSVSPVPPILPGKQLKFGARESYVYGILVSVSLGAIVFIPLTVELVSWLFQKEFHFGFAAVAKIVGTTVLAPLCVGMIIGEFAPGFATRTSPRLLGLGNWMLIAALLPILIATWRGIWSLVGNGSILAIMAVVASAIAAGHWIGGPDEHDRTALGIVSAMRHPGVALAIGTSNYPDNKLIPAGILLFAIVAVITTSVYGKLRLRSHPGRTGSSLTAHAP